MNECFKCGASGTTTRLFDAVSSDGIVKICLKCYANEKLPLIKKPTTLQLKESEKKEGFREKIMKFEVPKRNDLHDKENLSLRDIVDRNLKIPGKEEHKPRPDLIDNFHWTVMRVRRMKHISREQFAKDLGESETLIKMVEQGILPEDDNRIINKIEGYLNVELRKPEFVQQLPEKKLNFDAVSVRNLTISDLREIRKKRQGAVELWRGETEEEPEEKEEFGETKKKESEEELSDKEMDDILFGKQKR